MKTFLKALSILMIIGAVVSIILSVISIVGGGAIVAVDSTSLDTETAQTTVGVGVFAILIGIIALISGIFSLITGIFGVKGADGNERKLHTATILGWISLILSIVSAISSFSQPNANIASNIISVVLPALFVYAAMSVKKLLTSETKTDAQA